MTDAPRIISIDLTHLVIAALAAEADLGPQSVAETDLEPQSVAEADLGPQSAPRRPQPLDRSLMRATIRHPRQKVR